MKPCLISVETLLATFGVYRQDTYSPFSKPEYAAAVRVSTKENYKASDKKAIPYIPFVSPNLIATTLTLLTMQCVSD